MDMKNIMINNVGFTGNNNMAVVGTKLILAAFKAKQRLKVRASQS
jgi:hypothetical protein